MTSRSDRWVVVGALLLIFALILGACGGGAGTPAANEDQDDSGYADESAAGEEEAGAEATEDPNALGELGTKRRQATFKVAYQWTSGKDAPANETWYQKPPRSRIDFGSASDDHWMAQFVLDDGVFVCETSSGSANCWKAAETDAKWAEELSWTATIMTAYEELLSDPAYGAQRADRTIAGQRATCRTSTNLLVLGFAEMTLCHAGNGVPLLFEWKAESDTFRMEATSYTTSVTDEDFELFATPQ